MWHDIPCNQFSDEVMRCLPPKDWKITAQNSTGRHDLRDLPVMAIDPPNCQDIDDALYVKLLVNGNLQMGVHIADVTHFVAPDSPLDKEAADRGTSTYLVERRLDMLPDLLAAKLCSLTDVEDHFAITDALEILNDPDAGGIYGQDDNLTKEKGGRDKGLERWQLLGSGVKTLNAIARHLRAKRVEAGALTLASRFVLDTET
ncbi:hypothetical protein KRP22_014585 [Phytophthora ramorum]|nr:Exosome complex exonuclease RRP44 [Phytophthora ramorum]